ncbi:MAG: hypothetical protein IRY94_19385 [Rhodospirillaceae bacterium]|nr:hypothetical protein [Rhodospirillaceae bacterium]
MTRLVKIGQRYRSTEAPVCVWEVVELVELNGIAHAVLVLLRDPWTRKTVSLAGLLNRGSFELVADAAEPAGRERQRR